jgi:uncharacterized protein YjiS (DUF1127 family)
VEVTPVRAAISKWFEERRYLALVRELKAQSDEELRALGIARSHIDRLAREASLAGTRQINMPIVGALVSVGLVALWQLA